MLLKRGDFHWVPQGCKRLKITNLLNKQHKLSGFLTHPPPPFFVRTVLLGTTVRKSYPLLNRQARALTLHRFSQHTMQTKKIVSYVHKSSIDVVAALPINGN